MLLYGPAAAVAPSVSCPSVTSSDVRYLAAIGGQADVRLHRTQLVAGVDEVSGSSRELALIDLLIGGNAR